MSAIRNIWKRLTEGKVTRSIVSVDGDKREMTAEEIRLFDEAFGHFDATFAQMNKVFEEARRENARRKQ